MTDDATPIRGTPDTTQEVQRMVTLVRWTKED
jgi:hypothetical protein